jgi:carbamoyltransferase
MKQITNKEEAIDLILQQEIVAIFQGHSEWGPRALGNRSLLFDPRNKDGKDIVNKVKNREWYRPFAGSCLLEHADDWFEMGVIKESPYMTYAIPVKEEKKKLIPSITHVDGTCRIQTVTKEQNKKFYELIEEFYKRTEVPILFNTSFNLAGEPLVETLDDAHSTIERSDLNYLYLP